jgi:hypothetical protein
MTDMKKTKTSTPPQPQTRFRMKNNVEFVVDSDTLMILKPKHGRTIRSHAMVLFLRQGERREYAKVFRDIADLLSEPETNWSADTNPPALCGSFEEMKRISAGLVRLHDIRKALLKKHGRKATAALKEIDGLKDDIIAQLSHEEVITAVPDALAQMK